MGKIIALFLVCACISELAIAQSITNIKAGAKRIYYECGSPRDPVTDLIWVGNIRDQKNTGSCWAFATIAYLEAMYRALTCNNMFLSVEQVMDGMSKVCPEYKRPGFNGGSSKCALEYVSQYGIMTEYQYPFTSGGSKAELYARAKITPLRVNTISRYCVSGTLMQRAICAAQQLQESPLIASVCVNNEFIAVGKDMFLPRTVCEIPNHAVLIVGVGTYNNTCVGITFQNSWGPLWGTGGLGTILACEGYEDRDTYLILSELRAANVYEGIASAEDIDVEKAEERERAKNTAILIFAVVTFVVVSCAAFAVIGFVIWRRRKEDAPHA